jgi:hypothetical protein
MSKLHVAAAAAMSPLVLWPALGPASTPVQRREPAKAAPLESTDEARAGAPAPGAPSSFWWADYDGDGRVDAYVVQAGGAGRLLRNTGDGGFEDVTERAGLAGYHGAHMAVWADFDSDGRLDLYLPSATGESVLLGQVEGGAFQDRSELSGLPADARPLHAAVLDFDGDGRPDLHLSGPAGDALYHNRGVHCFARVPLELGVAAGAVVLSPGRSEREAAEPAPSAPPGSTLRAPSATPPAPTGAAGSGALPGSFSALCAPGVEDQDGGACIEASRTPTLDRLYPISEDLFVDAGTGRVGIGTTAPTRRLHVDGRVYAEAGGLTSPAIHGVSDSGVAVRGESDSDTNPTALFRQLGNDSILECENAAGLLPLRVRTLGGIVARSDNGAGNTSGNSAVVADNSSSSDGHALYAVTQGTGTTVMIEQNGGGDLLVADNPDTTVLRVRAAGGVTSTCTDGSNNLGLSTAVYATNTSTDEGNAILGRTTGIGTTLLLQQHGTGQYIKATDSTGVSKFRVTNTGRVVTTALQITGGGDLVEGFDAGDAELAPGTVVVIDPDEPGRVRESAGAYDPKVAGAISGAGGVDHGIRMGQDGVLDGEALVAMTGRIYVRCSAENGPIAPGDLLTSAELAGHAMKATDPARAFGAVIGKAMTNLDEGTGLVLVLVNLQ